MFIKLTNDKIVLYTDFQHILTVMKHFSITMSQYYSSKAIVLSAIKYGDTSRIVRLYTDQFGLISVLINSVSSKKSTVRSSMLLPLTLLEIIHTHKER